MKIQAAKNQRLFLINTKLLIAVIVLVPICIKLGVWQLDRADQKKVMQLQINEKFSQPAQDFCQLFESENKIDHNAIQFQAVTIQGQLTGQTFLIDNQIHKSKVGYEVIQVFKSCGINIALSRGFIIADPDRRVLPQIDSKIGQHQVEAYLYIPEKNQWIEDQPLEAMLDKPLRIAQAQPQYMSAVLEEGLFPAVARLKEDQPLLLDAHWSLSAMTPAKHLAYAVQWFGIALIVLILFFYSAVAHRFK